jgi:hypothetical protein
MERAGTVLPDQPDDIINVLERSYTWNSTYKCTSTETDRSNSVFSFNGSDHDADLKMLAINLYFPGTPETQMT